jgi:hypothetical protein
MVNWLSPLSYHIMCNDPRTQNLTENGIIGVFNYKFHIMVRPGQGPTE